MKTNAREVTPGNADGQARGRRFPRVCAALAAVAVVAGCAQDLGTIDRVQNNLVRKADLLYNEDGSTLPPELKA
jgi:hypothetical protein